MVCGRRGREKVRGENEMGWGKVVVVTMMMMMMDVLYLPCVLLICDVVVAGCWLVCKKA